MKITEYDLAFLQAAVSNLEEYLLSKQLFWPLHLPSPENRPPYPSLTLGNLKIAQRRLESLTGRGTPDAETFNEETAQVMEIKNRWVTHWRQKAAWEYSSRLNQWRNYLEDYRRNHGGQYTYYPNEVRVRVLLELLESEVGNGLDEEKELLGMLDTFIRSVFVPGSFVWDPEVSPAFPQETFWFLYGSLKK